MACGEYRTTKEAPSGEPPFVFPSDQGEWTVICILATSVSQSHRCNYTGGDNVVTREEPMEDITNLLSGLENRGWQARANCMGVDPDLFFPERGASTREAKEVCRGCVVREDCLEYALDNGEKFGIWGGMSERERRRLRRARAVERRGAVG